MAAIMLGDTMRFSGAREASVRPNEAFEHRTNQPDWITDLLTRFAREHLGIGREIAV